MTATRFRSLNVALVLVAAAAGVASYYGLRHTAGTTAPAARTATARRGVVLSSVSATGNVNAPGQLSVNFETGGKLVAIEAKKGQRVKRGQALARLDDTEARIGVQTAQASLRSAEAHLQQLLDGVTSDERAQDAISVKQAELALASAKASLAQAKAGNTTSFASSKLSLDQANAQLKRDQAQLAADNSDLAAAHKAVVDTQAAYDSASAQVDAARQKLAASQAALADAQTRQTTNQGDSTGHSQQLSKDQNDLSQAKSDLQAAESALQQAQSQLQQDQAACSADPASAACGNIAGDQSAVTSAQSAVGAKQSAVNSAQSAVSADQSQQSSDASTSTSDSLSVAAANRQASADQSALSDAQSALQDAKSVLTTAQNDVTSWQNAITSDRTKIVTDKNQTATLVVGLRSTKQKNAQSLTSAKQSVKGAQLGKTSAVLAKKVKEQPARIGDLESARAGVVTAQANLEIARKTLAESVLRAPFGGTVASVSGHVGEDVAGGGVSSGTSSGTDSTGSSALVTLVDLGRLEVTAGFSETDAAKVKVGQPATVGLDALPNAKLAAHVVAVDTLSTVVSNVVTYNVTFVLDRSTAGVKPGMSASVDVVTQERDNAITLPSSAVSGSGSAATVTVLRNGQQARISVVAGLQGDSNTEILSGLRAGETVVLPTATFASGTAGLTGTGGTGTRGGGLGGAVFVGPGG
jgi:macrolide-specific efflux system membrane fusion protein